MEKFDVSIYCPKCTRHVTLRVAPAAYPSGHDRKYTGAIYSPSSRINWWIGICNKCERTFLVLNNGTVVYPRGLPSPTDERIPEDIRKDLDEAKRCLSVAAFRACAVMARRALQATTIEKGASQSNLVQQINELESLGIITKDLKEWATIVRWVGNDAAHPNKATVLKEDAEDIVELTEQLLNVIFVTPALAKQRRIKRETKA